MAGWVWMLLSLFPITYRAGQDIYLEGGADQGLRPGMVLVVVRDTADTVGRVEVVSTTRTTALCRILEERLTLLPGDQAYPLQPLQPLESPSTGASSSAEPSAPGSPSWSVSGMTSVSGERLDLGGGRWSRIQTLRFRFQMMPQRAQEGWSVRLWGRRRWVVRTQVISVPDREAWWSIYEGSVTYRRRGWVIQGGRLLPRDFPEGGTVDGVLLSYGREGFRMGLLSGWPAQADSLPASGRLRLGGWIQTAWMGTLFRLGGIQDRRAGTVERERWLLSVQSTPGRGAYWLDAQVNRYPSPLFSTSTLPSWALTRLHTGIRWPLPWSLEGWLYARWDRVEWTPDLLQVSPLPTLQPRQVLGGELTGTLRGTRWGVAATWVRRPDAVEQLEIGNWWLFWTGSWSWRPSLDVYRNDLVWGVHVDLALSGTVTSRLTVQVGLRGESILSDASSVWEPAGWVGVYAYGPRGTFLNANVHLFSFTGGA
ncbi:MAG: hypothetical protein L3J76_03630 [Candidatus Hydrothermae bacterium]|nr:hypothetical protein [Candidatus Hydrothermae bacterium]